MFVTPDINSKKVAGIQMSTKLTQENFQILILLGHRVISMFISGQIRYPIFGYRYFRFENSQKYVLKRYSQFNNPFIS